MDKMRDVLRRAAATVLLALLAACGGSGDPPPIPARAGSAEIGAAGGSVDAILEGGAAVRIDLPPGALAQTITLGIDPVAPQGSAIGAFEIRPTGIVLAKPATLTVTSNGHLPDDAALMQHVGALSAQLSGTIGTSGQVQVLLSSLGTAPALAGVQAAGRAHALASNGSNTALSMDLQRLTLQAQVTVLNGAIDFTTGGHGSIDNALSTETAFEAVVSSVGPSQPGLRDAALRWRTFLCDQRSFAVSALNTFQGTDAPTFRLRARDALVWGKIAQDFAGTAATLAPPVAPCDGAPSDFRQPVRDKLPAFFDATRQALDLLDVGYRTYSDFDQLLDARLPELLGIEALLQQFDAGATLVPLLEAQANRLRLGAYRQCGSDGSQAHQSRLLDKLLSDPAFAGAANFDAGALRTDIHYCGALVLAQTLDASVQPRELANNERLHSLTETFFDPPAIRHTFNMSGARTLRLTPVFFDGMRALVCPKGLSRNNEQLVVEAGPSAQAFTELGRLTPSNAETYLAGGLDLSFDAARLASLASSATGKTLLRMRRSGDTCYGGFPGLPAHPVLMELELSFNPVTITTTSLPDAVEGQTYQTDLTASGGGAPYTWNMLNLPDGLSFDPVTGRISGTPARAENRSVVVSVTSANGGADSVTLPLTVLAPSIEGLYVGTTTFSDNVDLLHLPRGTFPAEARIIYNTGVGRIRINLRFGLYDNVCCIEYRSFVFDRAADGSLTLLGQWNDALGLFGYVPLDPPSEVRASIVAGLLQLTEDYRDNFGSVFLREWALRWTSP